MSKRKNIYPIIGVLLCSLAIILLSRFIFKGGFIEDKFGRGTEYYKGEVVKVISDDLSEDQFVEGIEVGFQQIVVKANEGPYKGIEYEIKNPVSRTYNYKVKEGTKVILGSYMNNNEVVMNVYNYDRSSMIYTLIALFMIAVIVIGGIKGVKSLVALLFTLVCCVYLMIPLMLQGISPIVSGVLIAVLSIVVTLTLVSGINKKTLTAILGTIIGVVISGVVAYIFGNLTNLSGFTMSDSESLMYISESTGLKLKGIMFAGILIASLGAVMDVAMSISASIFELDKHNKKLTIKNLFQSGMNIGRDIIGTMTNTLILAFAGGSLSTLILIFSAQMPYNKLINLDMLGIEIIQGLAGSIGIVLAVPITAIIASYYCKIQRK